MLKYYGSSVESLVRGSGPEQTSIAMIAHIQTIPTTGGVYQLGGMADAIALRTVPSYRVRSGVDKRQAVMDSI